MINQLYYYNYRSGWRSTLKKYRVVILMIKFYLKISLCLIVYLSAPNNLLAADYFFFCFPGAPGSKEQAAPIIDKLVKEIALNKKFTNLEGEYLNRLKDCAQQFNKKKPLFALVSSAVYFAKQKKWQLTPLLETISSQQQKRGTYRLMLNKNNFHRDWAKKIKIINSNTFDGTGFSKHLLKTAFDSKTLAKIKLRQTTLPLKSIKDLATAKIEAVLLTPLQYNSLSFLPAAKKIVKVWQSAAVPEALLVFSAKQLSPAKQQLLSNILLQISTTSSGKDILKQLRILRFSPLTKKEADSSIFGEKDE